MTVRDAGWPRAVGNMPVDPARFRAHRLQSRCLSRRLGAGRALGLLERNLGHPAHEFWPDDVSLVESVGPLAPRLQGHRQLSDVYLLGLALKHRGKLASFDGGLRGLAAGDRAAGLELVPTSSTPRGRR